MNAPTGAGSKTTKGPPVSDQKTVQVRGKALYLEFRQPATRATFQLLVHPDGSSGSQYVRFGAYYRTLTPSYPKRPWTTSGVSSTVFNRAVFADEDTLAPVSDLSEVLRVTELFQNHVSGIFGQLTRQGYGLYKQPVIVEISSVDYDDMAEKTTPYALFRRVMSARKALGFPDDLVAEATPPSTPTATI